MDNDTSFRHMTTDEFLSLYRELETIRNRRTGQLERHGW